MTTLFVIIIILLVIGQTITDFSWEAVRAFAEYIFGSYTADMSSRFVTIGLPCLLVVIPWGYGVVKYVSLIIYATEVRLNRWRAERYKTTAVAQIQGDAAQPDGDRDILLPRWMVLKKQVEKMMEKFKEITDEWEPTGDPVVDGLRPECPANVPLARALYERYDDIYRRLTVPNPAGGVDMADISAEEFANLEWEFNGGKLRTSAEMEEHRQEQAEKAAARAVTKQKAEYVCSGRFFLDRMEELDAEDVHSSTILSLMLALFPIPPFIIVAVIEYTTGVGDSYGNPFNWLDILLFLIGSGLSYLLFYYVFGMLFLKAEVDSNRNMAEIYEAAGQAKPFNTRLATDMAMYGYNVHKALKK